jgi:hypothetical protein
MLGFDAVIEQRIAEAARRGELDDLPGAGRPLELDDDRLIPAELRIAYRILKNAGYVPPEVESLKEIGELERMVQRMAAGEERTAAMKKLRLLSLRMNLERGGHLAHQAEYYDRLVDRLGG